MARLPNTKAEVFYSYQIIMDGKPVGTLQSFEPTQTRKADEVYEVNTNGGEIFEVVPGVPTYGIRLSKVRLYNDELFRNFGITAQDVQSQVQSIDIYETIYKSAADPQSNAAPDTATKIGTTMYEGCWITDWGKTVSTTGGTTIIENMTVKATRVVGIS